MWIERAYRIHPPLCSLIVETTRLNAIDRNVAIQTDPIVDKTILILYQFLNFFHFLQNFDPLSLT